MAFRISGVTLPNNKRLEVALTAIYGIGPTLSQRILSKTDINGAVRVKDLSEDETNRIRSYIESQFKVEGDLRREVSSSIKRLKEIGCYRGQRHIRHLPAHGQRTKTNSRTVRGNKRVTMGSGKKPKGQKT